MIGGGWEREGEGLERASRQCFHLNSFMPLGPAEACEKIFWKESCVSIGVRKPGNTGHHYMTLVVTMVLNPNTTNQLIKQLYTMQNTIIKDLPRP